MGRVCAGLPGQNVGARTHQWFMAGHAAGFCGRPEPAGPPRLSAAGKGALIRGYAAGRSLRAASDPGAANPKR